MVLFLFEIVSASHGQLEPAARKTVLDRQKSRIVSSVRERDKRGLEKQGYFTPGQNAVAKLSTAR
jgi:hypothetical protein